jgi:hypothetical protein
MSKLTQKLNQINCPDFIILITRHILNTNNKSVKFAYELIRIIDCKAEEGKRI